MGWKANFLVLVLVGTTIVSFYLAYQRFFIDKNYETYFSEEEAQVEEIIIE